MATNLGKDILKTEWIIFFFIFQWTNEPTDQHTNKTDTLQFCQPVR